MKKAKLVVFTFNVQCPYCLEECEEPDSNSYQWLMSDYVDGEFHACSQCAKTFELPIQVADNRLRVGK